MAEQLSSTSAPASVTDETGNLAENSPLPTTWLGNLTKYKRLATLPVKVGKLVIGGNNPLRIQSMTTSAPDDVSGLVAEITELYAAGADLVRLTVPSLAAVKSLEQVKTQLQARNLNVPLVADVHFTPKAALAAAAVVEKVRINPGNYVDKKRFAKYNLTPAAYQDELNRLEEKLALLLATCARYHTALRIGVNHGSLADRIVNHYGDSPYGMVQSALECLTIAEKYNFTNIVLSMKSSNPVTMTHAYRLLVHAMKQRKKVFPLHLGVTEAGNGMLGRIKSASGMAALLVDGIGDTIRVSLTEDAVHELPVCQKIRAMAEHLDQNPYHTAWQHPVSSYHFYDFSRRTSHKIDKSGGNEVPQVYVPAPPTLAHPPTNAQKTALHTYHMLYNAKLAKWELGHGAPDGVVVMPSTQENLALPPQLHVLTAVNALASTHTSPPPQKKACYFPTLQAYLNYLSQNTTPTPPPPPPTTHYVTLTESNLPTIEKCLQKADSTPPAHAHHALFANVVWLIQPQTHQPALETRTIILALHHLGERYQKDQFTAKTIPQPNITAENPPQDDNQNTNAPSAYSHTYSHSIGHHPIWMHYKFPAACPDTEERAIAVAFALAPLLIDGLIDGVFVENVEKNDLSLIDKLLQATRRRISQVDYISCPSCGRTLFDLQKVTAKIKQRTAHLKKVKIGIMGCIVNGPGEMADADYGYVGSGVGKITLYKGKTIAQRNIPENLAVDALVALIRHNGEWHDPPPHSP